ncbi:bifunctional DNA-formamidopyrimidine glycosylase/DNA-(apurinic or apyrimidinic site) lyase [Stagnihabitans tardus]|uniref:Formamidopyrimidine-DNA glycosylase n=1 Tax=Stagnihabitans tardus TaxID=2699202 RepID=A0AAE4Y9V2_9RHOB|nr:bifunctional DNA-formamidopyrimidine glycosylase/DNA-(apurinic or apyrimidinic site) lyase [Stagnihabitans tardus]NBZ87353.1 bifunctional DNA-formamidopyrimidine glycosylase/DNA-(apurinic or apyrimidinic site) lyase [Stagnihabitans tardus]
MPELPEVETVRRGLIPVMEGRLIARAQVNRPDLRFPLPVGMAERLTGARVTGLRRRSKYILADLSTDETLLIHLGMSGRMLISGAVVGEFYHPAGEAPGQARGSPGLGEPAHPEPLKHDHVVLDMEGGARVTFNDARRFGAMDLMATSTWADHKLIAGIGPEPLSNDFHETWLAGRLKGATPIKSALLDQKNVAGLGNIYVCEVLHRAGIAPSRLARDVTRAEVARLVPLIREVLSEAIEAGGSSLRDYRQADGELGYFQHTFRTYDREGEPCTTCATPIARIVQSGRSSFFCPHCQR